MLHSGLPTVIGEKMLCVKWSVVGVGYTPFRGSRHRLRDSGQMHQSASAEDHQNGIETRVFLRDRIEFWVASKATEKARGRGGGSCAAFGVAGLRSPSPAPAPYHRSRPPAALPVRQINSAPARSGDRRGLSVRVSSNARTPLKSCVPFLFRLTLDGGPKSRGNHHAPPPPPRCPVRPDTARGAVLSVADSGRLSVAGTG